MKEIWFYCSLILLILSLLIKRKTELMNKQNSIPPNVYDNPENKVPSKEKQPVANSNTSTSEKKDAEMKEKTES